MKQVCRLMADVWCAGQGKKGFCPIMRRESKGGEMDLKQLQYFVASVDSGSLKRASEILYTSQPHVSKTIKSLETELQVELLKRKARGVEVTKAGRKVYEYACRILMEAGGIQNVQEEGDIRVLCIAANSSDRLAYLFRRFYTERMQSGIHARYTECATEELSRLVHRHLAEAGFVYVDENQETAFRQMLEHRHLVFEKAGKTQPLLFAGPKSPLYRALSVTVKELGALKYVQMQDEQDNLSIRLLQRSEDYQYHRRRRQVLTTSSRYLLLQTIADTALCSISCGLCPALIGDETVRGIPIRGTENSVTFGFVHRKRDGLSPEAEQFTEYVKKYFDGEKEGRWVK
ncbi:MAG: LysR family transcriptional regulator [Lachnospiraceae bacterium]